MKSEADIENEILSEEKPATKPFPRNEPPKYKELLVYRITPTVYSDDNEEADISCGQSNAIIELVTKLPIDGWAVIRNLSRLTIDAWALKHLVFFGVLERAFNCFISNEDTGDWIDIKYGICGDKYRTLIASTAINDAMTEWNIPIDKAFTIGFAIDEEGPPIVRLTDAGRSLREKIDQKQINWFSILNILNVVGPAEPSIKGYISAHGTSSDRPHHFENSKFSGRDNQTPIVVGSHSATLVGSAILKGLEVGRAKQASESAAKRDKAKTELLLRKAQHPRATKNAIMTAMSKLPDQPYGSLGSIKGYCTDIKFEETTD